jgi:aspartate-semialdehyde dehydrogenase
VGPHRRGAGRGRGRQQLGVPHGRRGPPGRQRGQPGRAADPPEGHRRQPELHHDGADGRGEAAARRLRSDRGGGHELPGAGQAGIRELLEQSTELVGDEERLRSHGLEAEAAVETGAFSKAIAFNALPHCGSFTDERYTDEEWKLVNESRKILNLPALRVSPTCVRVPVVVGHGIAARLTFAEPVTRDGLMAALDGAPGLVIEDGTGLDGEPLAYPSTLGSAGRDEVIVGRVREDLGDPYSANLFVAGDNLLKGAALNAVQLAELIAAEG